MTNHDPNHAHLLLGIQRDAQAGRQRVPRRTLRGRRAIRRRHRTPLVGVASFQTTGAGRPADIRKVGKRGISSGGSSMLPKRRGWRRVGVVESRQYFDSDPSR